MAIQAPGRRLLADVPLRFVSERVAGGGRKHVDASITLVPFIDFLIVLVVFLLSSFGRDTVAQSQDMQLPDGVHVAELAEAPVISIDRATVSVEGLRVGDTASLAASADVSRIEPLVQNLETLSRNRVLLHGEDAATGTVIIQADESTDYRVIKKVLFSAAQAGYADIHFAVNDVHR